LKLAADPFERQLQQALRNVVERSSDGTAWAGLAELGALELAIPAEAGGLNLGQRAAALVCEELGRAALVTPFLDTMLAVDCLLEGTLGAGDRLAAIASGSLRVSAAGGRGASLRVAEAGGGWELSGRASAALAHEADQLLVAASDGAGGGGVFLFPAARPGWSFRVVPDIAGGGLAALRFSGLRLEPGDRIAVGARLPERALARARLRQAAYLVGLAAAAQEAGATRARSRKQFGKSLADFQAISFRLAALAVEVEAARLLVQQAAWAEDNARPALVPATQALAAAAELALEATRQAIQVHGALGMTAGAAVERFYRVALLEAVRLGRPASLWREAGRLRLAAGTSGEAAQHLSWSSPAAGDAS
jgi:alkylation response protein AidB-like acyl-CoA dehydrogenase